MLKRSLVLLALVAAAAFSLACDDAPESGRAIMDVSDVNGNQPVELSVSSGATDNISMVFRWRPYLNTLIDVSEATPHGDVIVEHYRITWTRTSAGSGVLPPREEETNIFVPVYELVTGAVRLVTAEEKADPSLAGTPVTMVAHVEFTGREMGNTHEIKFATNFTVHFVN